MILLNVLVVFLIFFLMNGDPSRSKWLETWSYKEPEVRIQAHDTRYHGEPEKRDPQVETSMLIKTASRKIVDKSLTITK